MTAIEPVVDDDRMRLYRGDALAVLRQLPDECVDAVITDPPYSSGGQYRADRAGQTSGAKYNGGREHSEQLPDFTGDNRDQRGYAYWCALWLAECLRVTRPGGGLAVFSDWRQLPTTTDAVQSGGWVWRGLAAWAKPDARPQLGRPTQACEFVVWATNGPRPVEGKTMPGWWFISTPRNRNHQTEKPLPVMRDLVQLAPAGGIVLDPFMGSGTTGVACLAEGRRFWGIEQSRAYVDRARGRLDLAAARPGSRDVQDALPIGGDA